MEDKNKLAIVTGGSRGIGKAIVEKLIAEQYFVEFTYVSSKDEAANLEMTYPGKCKAALVDGKDSDQVDLFVKSVVEKHNGRIDLLVNNSGITQDVLIKDSTYNDYRNTFDNNVGATFNFSKTVLPVMMKNRYGNIINISSLATNNIRYGNAFYGTSKAAIERFSKSLALEAIRFNVAVNVIAPGFVETDLIKRMTEDMKTRKELISQIPRRKFTQPEEVADLVKFLADRKPLLIGAIIPLGGGGQLI
ncbi:SDR family NAD(P)-dependent oxidoreductase [Anaeromicropila populeti]|uniref:3-oxoacyl-[acyl-carrier protein] reductase n=1 Tax=Anaeromicropila populeti TaxID=37658 RepID=A0A1I6HSC6_9FIRM|nr:SDR family NAD(P)-dependent oxidoreductase [Anaeromicropila populeti]SFR57288.1 3-oxoacyl-[acyl-carrier protein] reductase [Anaeromicropila populeti]